MTDTTRTQLAQSFPAGTMFYARVVKRSRTGKHAHIIVFTQEATGSFLAPYRHHAERQLADAGIGRLSDQSELIVTMEGCYCERHALDNFRRLLPGYIVEEL
jgi:hypothetical protein